MLRAVLRCPPTRLALGRRCYSDGGNNFDLGSLLNRIDAATRTRPKPAPKPRAPRGPRPQGAQGETSTAVKSGAKQASGKQGPRPGPRPGQTGQANQSGQPRPFQRREQRPRTGTQSGRPQTEGGAPRRTGPRPGPRPPRNNVNADGQRRPFERRPQRSQQDSTSATAAATAAAATDIEYRFDEGSTGPDPTRTSRGTGIGRRQATGEQRTSTRGRRQRPVATRARRGRAAAGEDGANKTANPGSRLWRDPMAQNFSPEEALELCLGQAGTTDNYVTPTVITPELLAQNFPPTAATWRAPFQKTFDDFGPVQRSAQGYLPVLPEAAPANDPIAQYVAGNTWMSLKDKEFIARVGRGEVPISKLKVYEP